MATLIKDATTINEINDVLKLRFSVLNESGKLLNELFVSTGKISDFFDVYPNTYNVIAYRSGEPIATLRAVPYYPPKKLGGKNNDFDETEHDVLDEVFDYTEANQQLKGEAYLIDIILIRKKESKKAALIMALFKNLLGTLAGKNVDHVFLNVTRRVKGYTDELGFRPLGDPFYSNLLNSDVTPSVLDVKPFYESFVKSIEDREILRFQDTFYHIVYEPGEMCMTHGEKGTTAILIESGEVEVLIDKDDQIIPIATIGKGNLIGEIGLVTNERRTASIMARTPTSCIAFDRESFLEMMTRKPNLMLDMFKVFSKRLQASNKELAKLRKS